MNKLRIILAATAAFVLLAACAGNEPEDGVGATGATNETGATGATGAAGRCPTVGVVIVPGSRVTLLGVPVEVGAVGVDTGALSPSKKFLTVSMKDLTCLRMLMSFMIAL